MARQILSATMSAKASALDKLKADTAYFEELRRKSEKERIRRKAGAKKLKDEAQQKKLLKEQEAKAAEQRALERQKRQAKVSVEVTLSMKKVIDHLTEVKQLVALDAIFKQLGCKGSKIKLLDLLRKSPFVEVRDETKPVLVKYKSKYDIKDESELLDFMYRHWSKPVNTENVLGVALEDVADSYLDCDKDINKLVAQGKFYSIMNPKVRKAQVFYPDKATQHKPLDPQLLTLWNERKVESEEDLEKALRESGIAPAKRVFKWRSLLANMKKKKGKKIQKKPREYTARNVTNAHMPELFQKKLS